MDTELDASPEATRRYRRRSTSNLLRMGHCAPTVARTLLDVTRQRDAEWLVRLSAGLPGGIGDTGHECGAVTAPLLWLGLRCAGSVDRGLPVIFDQGHAYCARFLECHGSLSCKAIRGDDRLLRRCIGAIRTAPELLAGTASGRGAAIPAEDREAYRALWGHFSGRGFHCAHAVLRRLVPVTPALLDATAGFVGGTLFQGMTCSALVAGVMVLGLEKGEVEDNRLKVARMIARMIIGGDVLDDRLNAFNASVKRGKALARWFAGAHGSTQCRAVTGCTFSSRADVERYVREGQVARCELLAAAVAGQVEAMVGGRAEPA